MKATSGIFRRGALAFSLIEMLVVIAIIGILAGIGLPHLKGWGEGNAMTAATRQLMDDLAYARLKAISTRSPVYVVFVSSNVVDFTSANATERKNASNLWSGQFTSYAVYAPRQVGDQPGRDIPRYLTPWKTLPDNIFIATRKFVEMPEDNRFSTVNETNSHNRPFSTAFSFPFPTANSTKTLNLPFIQFNSRGQMVSERTQRATIPLARGSIFYARDAQGNLTPGPADVVETPAQNSVNNKNWIHIDYSSGRAQLEREEIQ